MRVPFIASWIKPNQNVQVQKKLPIARNAIQQQMGSILDIFPTLCQVAQVKKPVGHITDGFELNNQLMGKKETERKELFLNHFPHGDHRSNYFSSLVNSDWKIIYHYQVEGKPNYDLFNLKVDPFETNNLADKNPNQLKKMMETLAEELRINKARFPEKDGDTLELIMPK
jgi:arylsulfatase A-like enzyme